MSLVTVKSKFQVVIPRSVRRQMALALGDTLEAKVEHGKITLTPTLAAAVHAGEVSTAKDEYTAAQRRKIDARLRQAEEGPVFGPFKSGEEIAAFLKGPQLASAVKRTRPKR